MGSRIFKNKEEIETKSFKLFGKKTPNFFKCGIENLPSHRAAVTENEDDYIEDKNDFL